jgi:uncharacterized protein
MAVESVLITGASSGIGLHLAHEFARNGHPLVLVAPDAAELDRLAIGIGNDFGVDVLPVACDLRQPDATDYIASRLGGRHIDILVNNAGHGQRGQFWTVPLERHLSIVQLNIEAVLRLTARFLPPMLERGRGRIMNTASVAGFEPGPLLAVYHASKAFVLSFSEALAQELDGSPVTVTALCPGPTDTDFFTKADMLHSRAFQEAKVMAPQDVARAGYEGVMQGDPVVVPGMGNKALVFARRLLPEMTQARMNEKLYQDAAPDKRTRTRGDIERGADHGGH